MFNRIGSSEATLALLGGLLAAHYKIVGLTNKTIRSPDTDFYDPFNAHPAFIIALWHGQHFLMPFFGWHPEKLNILITTHRDGEILARACGHFGLRCIRGSGGRDFVRKKAVRAFTTMLRTLQQGDSMVMTADVPKVARVAGLGIVTLAKHSGCPIIPVAMATSRRFELSNWDRTCINLPFGRMAMVRGEPIPVDRGADDAALEVARAKVEQDLNEVTARAYQLCDSTDAQQAVPSGIRRPKEISN
jgi:lysophospholipid acyltransferase (LPLAT)-like uncharacterized protein